MATEYTSAEAISNQLGRALTSDETALLTVLIPAIRIWIDNQLDTTFVEAEESTRLYDVDGSIIDIDPCTAVTKLESIDNDLETTSDYETNSYVLEPQNKTVKTQIRFRWSRPWRGIGNIRVTAKFSEYDGGVPEDIQLIATRIAAGIIKSNADDADTGAIKTESIEGHSITYESTAIDIDKFAASNSLIGSMLSIRKRPIVG